MPMTTSDPVLEAKRKFTALARAERRIKQRMLDIEWELNELQPALKQIDLLAAVGQLPDIELLEGGVFQRLKELTDGSS